jgi:hypothetical protein
MKEAIAAARDIRDQSSKAFTLALLAPDMPEEERPAALAEALAEVRAGGDEFTQFRALVVLAPHLAREEKVTAFENIIETMERLPRHECFDTLGSLALPLADLGGSKLVQDIGRTVRDIAQWWH